jgi:hypothetical protein
MATKLAFLGEQPRRTEAELRARRRKYDRLYKASCPSGVRVTDARILIPDDITVLTRDPFPCGYCGKREPCRHRPWEAL